VWLCSALRWDKAASPQTRQSGVPDPRPELPEDDYGISSPQPGIRIQRIDPTGSSRSCLGQNSPLRLQSEKAQTIANGGAAYDQSLSSKARGEICPVCADYRWNVIPRNLKPQAGEVATTHVLLSDKTRQFTGSLNLGPLGASMYTEYQHCGLERGYALDAIVQGTEERFSERSGWLLTA
jgi:hypothetical protein